LVIGATRFRLLHQACYASAGRPKVAVELAGHAQFLPPILPVTINRKLPRHRSPSKTDSKGAAMILALISVLTIVVVGAICFWAIDKFANDRRLANLLKLLVILICLGAILQRILPLTGIY
jgi:hypothetical protein